MHLKNFSMIESRSGWLLAPAYDLLNAAIVNPEDTEELALTLEGKKKKLKKEHFERLGKGIELTEKQIQGVVSRMIKHKPLAGEWINNSFLSPDMKEAYNKIMDARYFQLKFTKG